MKKQIYIIFFLLAILFLVSAFVENNFSAFSGWLCALILCIGMYKNEY